MKPPIRTGIPRKIRDEPAAAEDLAPQILAFIAQDQDRLLRFLDLTGLTPQSLRGAAAQPGFALSLLEYLASDDRLFLAFATDRGHDPARLETTRQRLLQASGRDD